MMNWILVIMAGVVAVVLALILGGLASQRTRMTAREARLRAPIERVWPLLKAAEETPAWCPDLPNMRVLDESPPRLLRLQLVNDSGDAFGEWIMAASARDGGTQLSLAETCDMHNPIERFFRSFTTDTRRVDGFIRALAQELGERDITIGDVSAHPRTPSATPPS